MIRLSMILTVAAVVAGGGCRNSERTMPVEASSRPSGAAVPAEIQAVAERALGPRTEVLVFGDLAHNGRMQALVVNRLGQGTPGSAVEVLVTRAAILERESTHTQWNEVLRCDEYLKNPKGFLQGAQRLPTTRWQLRIDRQGKDSVRAFYFTPLRSENSAGDSTVAVRWNPKVGRYQSLGKNGQFLGEIVALEIPGSELR